MGCRSNRSLTVTRLSRDRQGVRMGLRPTQANEDAAQAGEYSANFESVLNGAVITRDPRYYECCVTGVCS